MLTSYNSITTNPLTAGTVEILKNVSVKTRVVDLYTFFANPDPDPAVLKMWISVTRFFIIFYFMNAVIPARSRTPRRLTLRDVDN